jgi:hypothetical protein
VIADDNGFEMEVLEFKDAVKKLYNRKAVEVKL